ncbi:unnamed protein product [Arabis nemorensis]|uniref:Uncharacterized protein n=1 Tax=Arabis nemorensis TaxID=586526 RepID=A0A565BTH4_9BRAS|nr:unnamed protein product [Arabis nemorensis]
MKKMMLATKIGMMRKMVMPEKPMKPWCEETESEFLLREEGYEDDPDCGEFTHEREQDQFVESYNEEKSCEESDSQISLGVTEPWNEDNFGVESGLKGEEPEPGYISFSGFSQGLEGYIRWERDMGNWFQSNQVPEEEKTIYAEKTLTTYAFRHCEKEYYMSINFDEPTYSWEDMKKIMYEEFVKDAETSNTM